MKYNEPVPLERCHLVVNTTIEILRKIVKVDLEEIYNSLEIQIGQHIYDIVLKPFNDDYHNCWVHADLERLKECEDEEIYIKVTNPGDWNDFNFTLDRINQLSKDSQQTFDESDVFYVDIPWTSVMHRWN